MGWETRPYGRYYYRKRRIGQRVVSEYVGSGAAAELCAALDTEECLWRQERRKLWRREQERERAIDAGLDALGELTRELTSALLLASGYHTHKGQWRRTRNGR